MKVRGERECQDCGTRWSYYDTGSVACPDCGSLRSVGVEDEARRHTDAPVDLDLSPHGAAVADGDLVDVADDLASDLREYVRRRGFIDAGDLRHLDDTYLAVQELRYAIEEYARDARLGVGTGRGDPDDDVERYLLRLLRGADRGDRPPVEEVPDALAPARALACAAAIDDYRDEVTTYLDDHPDPEARRTLGRIRDRVRRVTALDGDVPLAEVETLVRATREVGEAVVDDDETALARAGDRLDGLD